MSLKTKCQTNHIGDRQFVEIEEPTRVLRSYFYSFVVWRLNMTDKTDPYRIFPPATEAQKQELRTAIEAAGLKNPVVMDEHRNVIDGHTRRDICEELGLDWLKGADVQIGLPEIEKRALAIELNMWRRPLQLTPKLRRELVSIYLQAHADLSVRQVAELFGVSKSQVQIIKTELSKSGQLPKITSTIGQDGVRRKIGKRNGKRITIKDRKEYENLMPDIREVSDDLGENIIRKPAKIAALAKRKRALKNVKPVKNLPKGQTITCSDFRNLEIKKGSVDLILTDVVWDIDCAQDWFDLGELAAEKWLKPDGLFVSYIGTMFLPHFCNELMHHLKYQWTISMQFVHARRIWSSRVIEHWRPIVVFGKRSGINLPLKDTVKSPTEEKDFDDWQQSLYVSRHLMERLSKPGDVVLDPHLGTGTNGVAAAQLGDRQFIGCDIDPEKIKIARHRIDTEGKQDVA
jgi:DNA methylase/ParB/Sulfiredoxin domain